jgi:ribonuclease P protein component
VDRSFGFAKRFHYRRDYLRIFSQSERLALPSCRVFRLLNDSGHFRLGVTVKTKANAVVRNRIKRTIRELFRLNQAFLGSFDYNVVVSMDHPDFVAIRKLRSELETVLPEFTTLGAWRLNRRQPGGSKRERG